jgi:uncharacterized protein (DUF427 family)
VRALWNGTVLADSERTVEVDGYVYFPREAVRMDLLRAAPKTAGDRQCPHGVQFFDVAGEGRTAVRNAWSYERPGERMRRIDRWIGFWDEVEIVG